MFVDLKLMNLPQELQPYKQSQDKIDFVMSALSTLKDKNAHLEHSLSAETRIKLDLFSALGEAKRQLEIKLSNIFDIILFYKYVVKFYNIIR